MLLRGNEREQKRRLDYELLAFAVGLIVLPCTGMNFIFASVGKRYSGVFNHMLSLKLLPSTQVNSSLASIYGRRSKEFKNQKGGRWGRWLKKSSFEVDLGTTWSGAQWLGPKRSFVFRSHLLLVVRWAWGRCGFNTKHQST